MNISHVSHCGFVDPNGICFKNAGEFLLLTVHAANGEVSLRPLRRPNSNGVLYTSGGIPFQSFTEPIVNMTPISTNGIMLLTRLNEDAHDDQPQSDTPVYLQNIKILQTAMILVYSQHCDEFKQMTRNFDQIQDSLTDQMKTFYTEIIDGVNGSYVLK
jgi:hypothetical protein